MQRILHLATASLTFAAALSLFCSPARAGLKEGVAAYKAGNLTLAYQEFRGER